MQNKLTDLNNHLFEQLERLLDDDVCKDKESAELEISKAKMVCEVSQQIVGVAQVQLQGIKLAQEWNLSKLPETLSLE